MSKTYSSPEIAALYASIGMSLSAWSSVEGVLCSIFCGAINPEWANPADKAFWAVVSFEGRMGMTSEVVLDTVHEEELLAVWTSIENKLRRSAKLRNKIAHGSVVRMRNPKTKKQELFLVPYFGSARIEMIPTLKEAQNGKFDPRPKTRLTTEAIEEIARGFTKLRERLYAFRRQQIAYIERCGGTPGRQFGKVRQGALRGPSTQKPPKS